jgi:broad specificity phosphatase PhoE
MDSEVIWQKWPKELVIVRHGQSARNVAKDKAKKAKKEPSWADAVRDVDTPLTQVGELQAIAVGTELRRRFPQGELGLDVIFASPYLRTRQTAEGIIKGLGYYPKLVSEERIREIEFGILDGLTPDGIRAKYPEEVARRAKEGKYWYRPPGGESRPDVALRVHSFLGTLNRDYRKQRCLVICHSVVVLIFRRLLERWTEEQYIQVDKNEDPKNCSITSYKLDTDLNKLLLDEYNTICYPEDKVEVPSADPA